MKVKLIIGVLGLLGGLLFGYLIGYFIYSSTITDLKNQVATLESDILNLNQTIIEQKNTISAADDEISSLESNVNSLQIDLDRVEDELSDYIEYAAIQESRLAIAQETLTSTQESFNRVLSIEVIQHYEWDYGFREWSWDLPIYLSSYVEYYEKTRPQDTAQYVDMAKGTQDDIYINNMVQKINEAAAQKNYNESQTLNFVIAFVQSLPYTVDVETTPYDEYPRYPLETLFSRGGDCEDTSILVAALLDEMGYDVALLVLSDAHHMAVGVAISGSYGTYYEYNGKKYFFLETTGEGWEIGQFPSSITETKAYVYPLRG